MGRYISKKQNIQEANKKLENRILNENSGWANMRLFKDTEGLDELGDIDMKNITQLRQNLEDIKTQYSELRGILKYYENTGNTEHVEKMREKIKNLEKKEEHISNLIDKIWEKDRK
jgi:hypothetical protein